MTWNRLPSVLLACLTLAVSTPARAEPTDGGPELPGELRNKTFGDLEKEARELLAKKDYSAAIEKLQALVDELGERLVPLGANRDTLVSVRRLCHLQFASLPPEALRLYRNRVDPQARVWLEQGTARRDPAPLLRLLEEAFCSRPGEQALDLLGDLAFERGCFDEAERWWRMLLPAEKKLSGLDLLYPDPQADLALVRAKLLLARLFRGNVETWSDELASFRKLHPDVEGLLAGRKGKYADTLAALGRDAGALRVEEPDHWPTFGGSPSRSRILPPDSRDPNRLTRLCQLPPWRFDLEKRARIKDEEPLPQLALTRTRSRRLAFSPVMVGKQALVADARYVTSYDLTNGEVATWFDLRDKSATPEVDLQLPAKPDLRYTLTVADDAVYARLGAQALQEVPREGRGRTDSFLVCLRLQPGPNGERLRWQVSPEPDGAIFEGAPVVAGGRAYIAATRFVGDQSLTAIHCYSVEAEGTPTLRWRQEVWSRTRAQKPRYTHHLLTLAGPHVVFCSHSGAIVALDAATGRHAWAVRYPSRGEAQPGGEPSPRDLTPCVYHSGRLFAAPADGDRLFCLDPASGQLLWQRDRIEVVQLLGVGQGRLIFTTSDAIRGVRVADGGDVPGWHQPGDGSKLTTFGRGLLAGDLVYWPTVEGLFLLNQRDGAQPDGLAVLSPEKARLLAGNLAMGDGCLAVADARELRLFTPPARRLREQQNEAKVRPDSSLAQLRLALAEADAGLRERARGSFAAAERLAGGALFGQRELLHRDVRQGQHDLLREMAAQAATEGRHLDAVALTREAGRSPLLTRPMLRVEVEKGAHADEPETNARLVLDETPPALPLPLCRSWEVRLTPGERLLIPERQRLRPVEKEQLFLAAGRRLTCRLAATGSPAWTTDLPFSPTWVRYASGDHDGLLVVVAGPEGAACLWAGSGRRLWLFSAPMLADGPATLKAFHLDGRRLSLVVGLRWWLAIDVGSGSTLWNRELPAGDLPRSGLSAPLASMGGNELVLQTAGGWQWVIDAQAGAHLHRHAPRADPLFTPRSPLFLSRGAVCLLTDSRHVSRVEPTSSHIAWTHEVPGATTRTGETPWLLGDEKTALLLAARNYGYTLQRLHLDTGKPLWTEECLLSHAPIDPANIAQDEVAIYHVANRVLYAHRLSDGQRLWEQALPGPAGRWQVIRAGNSLLTYPLDGLSHAFQFRCRWVSLQWEVIRPPEDRPFGFPVLICNPKTGQLIQRLNLSSPEGRMMICKSGLRAAVPTVQSTGGGIVVALEGRAWGFQGFKRTTKE